MTGPLSIAALLSQQAASRPRQLAVTVEGGDDLAFADWERRSSSVARGLAGRGTEAGDRVALRFDARHWAAFAVGYVGVLKAGAVAVLVPAGLARADADRIVRHCGAAGVLGPAHLLDLPAAAWAADPGDVERDGGPDRRTGAPDPDALAELAYPLAPLSRPRPVARTRGEVVLPPGPGRAGWLVHAWAPCSAEGPLALAHALARNDTGAAALARFSPAGLTRLVARLGATACGLTPGLAAALVASDPPPAALRSVTTVWLSPPGRRPSRPPIAERPRAVATPDLGAPAPPDESRDRRAASTGPAPGPAPPAATDIHAAPRPGAATSQPPPVAALARLFPAAVVLDLGATVRPDAHAGRRPRAPLPKTTASAHETIRSGEAADVDPPPVGAAQLGMLWHEQLAPGSFNLPCLVRRFVGRLDVDALERALAELVHRHEPLRTTFEVVAGRPRQVVGAGPGPLPLLDVSGLQPPAQEAEMARIVGDASTQPFDLVAGHLFAARLVRLGPDDHVLVVRLHHIVFDDWSVGVYRHELSALYAAFRAGDPSPLPEPATRFVDLCRRQQDRREGPAGEGRRASWRAQMDGAPFAVQLHLGAPSELGPDRPGAGEPLRHDLRLDLAEQVRALAPRLRATPFMTVLAAFEVLLARRTGQDDLVIASVVAGRSPSPVEAMIGCFTRKVLLRLRTGGDPTFPELVARTRGTVLGALDDQDVPFEAAVQDALGRTASQHGLAPQVPVVFQAEPAPPARLRLPGVEVGPFAVPASTRRERHFSTAEADDATGTATWGDGAYQGGFLILSLLQADDGLALVARGVFSRPAARRLLSDLEALLADIVGSPGRRLSELAPEMTGPVTTGGADLALRGLSLHRSRLEAALAGCPGVAEVAVAVSGPETDPRLVAYVVADRIPPPTLAQLRAALWTALPGSPWPAATVSVDALPRRGDGGLDDAALPPPPEGGSDEPDPVAALLTALWSTCSGQDVSPGTSYWQDFSFLQALAEARAAGLPITDEQVRRCRTPEMLAAALAAGRR